MDIQIYAVDYETKLQFQNLKNIILFILLSLRDSSSFLMRCGTGSFCGQQNHLYMRIFIFVCIFLYLISVLFVHVYDVADKPFSECRHLHSCRECSNCITFTINVSRSHLHILLHYYEYALLLL